MKNVFISYSHQDEAAAMRLKHLLAQNNIGVLIDTQGMNAGDKIKQFIQNSVISCDVTLSVVSSNSLKSAWVAMETLKTFYEEKLRRRTRYIACCLDGAFHNRSYVDDVRKEIRIEVDKIRTLLQARKQDPRGGKRRDLHKELSRYKDLEENIDKIVQRLKESAYIDISGGKLETEFPRILEAILNDSDDTSALSEWWRGLSAEWRELFERNAGSPAGPESEFLTRMVSLRQFDCHKIEITSLEPLHRLKLLETLYCNDTLIRSLGPLSGMRWLTFVDCSNTFIADLQPLYELGSLKAIVCLQTKLTADDIERYKEKNHACQIYH